MKSANIVALLLDLIIKTINFWLANIFRLTCILVTEYTVDEILILGYKTVSEFVSNRVGT